MTGVQTCALPILSWFEHVGDLSRRSGPERTSLERIECDQCQGSFGVSGGFVAPSTWIHTFRIETDYRGGNPFNLDTYPNYLDFEEFNTGNHVRFEIAYFTLSSVDQFDPITGRIINALGHQTSIHRMAGQNWMWYDGMRQERDGQVVPIPPNLHLRYHILSVTYIRRLQD